MLQDPLADALVTIKNAEKMGKNECVIRAGKLLENILAVMKESGYIGDFETVQDGRGNKFRIQLKGKIIDTSVVKPRFAVGSEGYEKWEKRFLPGRNIGILIVSTSKGVMPHTKAKEMQIGGRLLSFVY